MVQSDASFASIHNTNRPPRWISASVASEASWAREEGWSDTKRPQCCFFVGLGLCFVTIWICLLALFAAGITKTMLVARTTTNTMTDVISGMKDSPKDPGVQARGCIIAWGLSEHHAEAEKLYPHEQLAILKALEMYPYHSEVPQHCLHAIRSSFPTIETGLVDEQKIVTATSKTMVGNRDKLEVQLSGIRVLSILSRACLLRTSSVMPLILNSLKRFPRHHDLVSEGLGLITHVAMSDDASDIRSEDDSILARASALLSNQLRKEDLSSCTLEGAGITTESIVELTLGLLAHQDFDLPNVEVRLEAYGSAWKALKKYDKPEIVHSALHLLFGLAMSVKQSHDFYGFSLAETDLLLDSLAAHSSNEDIQLLGAQLLALFPPSHLKRMIVNVMMEAIERHGTNRELVQSCFSVLSTMNSLDLYHLLVNHNIGTILEVLWRFQSYEDVQAPVFKILTRYVELSSSLPSKEASDELVLHVLNGVSSILTPKKVGNPLKNEKTNFFLTTILYFLDNEYIQEQCIAGLAELGPISETKGFDIVRGAYRAYGAQNSSIRKNALTILAEMGHSASG